MTIYQQLRSDILAAVAAYEASCKRGENSLHFATEMKINRIHLIISEHDKQALAYEMKCAVKTYVKSWVSSWVRWVPGFSLINLQSMLLKVLRKPEYDDVKLNIHSRDECREQIKAQSQAAKARVARRTRHLQQKIKEQEYALKKAHGEIDRLNIETAFLSETLGDMHQQLSMPCVKALPSTPALEGLSAEETSLVVEKSKKAVMPALLLWGLPDDSTRQVNKVQREVVSPMAK